MSSPTLGPGSIVRWKGVSTQCMFPKAPHGLAEHAVGRVLRLDKPMRCSRGLDAHTVVVQVDEHHITNVRPDEVEVIDEWGAPGDHGAAEPVTHRLVGAGV